MCPILNPPEDELNSARHVMYWITREELLPIEKPDTSRPSRPDGHPDFVFQDSTKRKYVVELTRLLTPQLRNLTHAVSIRVCEPLALKLPGTYALQINLTDPLGRGRIAPVLLNQAKEEIERLLQTGILGDKQQLECGFVVWKARDDGSRLVPWVTSPELPFDLNDTYPISNVLRVEFEKLLKEADSKFKGYKPYRILVIGTSQSGLDLEFHAGRFKDGQGILLTWMNSLSGQITNIDEVFLEPGINVWSEGSKVMDGHKYTETKAGHYISLWRRQGIEPLLV